MFSSLLENEITTKHCGEKIRACHTVSLVLGILAALLFLSNIITIAYVNRRPIVGFLRRLIGTVDDDMRRNIIASDTSD